MSYVLDTHALIWFLTSDNKLGNKALELLRRADTGKETIIIPTVVLAEVLYICEKNKVAIKFKEIFEKINEKDNYIVYDLNLEVILKLEELSKIHELHDRIILATAVLSDSKIITRDGPIKESNYAEVVW